MTPPNAPPDTDVPAADGLLGDDGGGAARARVDLPTRLRRQVPALVALAVGLAASVALFYVATRVQDRRTAAAFHEQVAAYEVQLQKGITGDLVVLGSVVRFYAASKVVDRSEFAEFLRDTWDDHGGIGLIAWAPRVDAQDLRQFEFRAVDPNLGAPANYKVRTAPPAESGDPPPPPPPAAAPATAAAGGADAPLFPILFAEGAVPQDALLGVDVAGLPGCASAIARAIAGSEQAATPPVRLADGTRFDCLVFQPTYAHVTADPTPLPITPGPVMPDGRMFTGVAVAALQFDNLLDPVRRELQTYGIDAGLFDRSDKSAASPPLLHPGPNGDYAGRVPRPAAAGDAAGTALVRRFPIYLGGRHWEFTCVARPEFAAERRTFFRWGVLLTSLLFTALATAYLVALGGRAARIAAVVTERTAELRAANAELVGLVIARDSTEEKLRKSEAVYHSVGSSRVDLQACKLEYSIVSPK